MSRPSPPATASYWSHPLTQPGPSAPGSFAPPSARRGSSLFAAFRREDAGREHREGEDRGHHHERDQDDGGLKSGYSSLPSKRPTRILQMSHCPLLYRLNCWNFTSYSRLRRTGDPRHRAHKQTIVKPGQVYPYESAPSNISGKDTSHRGEGVVARSGMHPIAIAGRKGDRSNQGGRPIPIVGVRSMTPTCPVREAA